MLSFFYIQVIKYAVQTDQQIICHNSVFGLTGAGGQIQRLDGFPPLDLDGATV